MTFPKLIAHRGLHNIAGGIPENSLPAFLNAVFYGVAAELDVRLSSDGKIVVFHDSNLIRMCGVDLTVENSDYLEIRKYRLQNTSEHIPLLCEVLDAVSGRVPLLIEIKDGTKVGILEEKLVKMLSGYKGAYAVQAFNPCRVLWLKNNCPGIKRGQLSRFFESTEYNFLKKYALTHMLLNAVTKPDFVSYDISTMPNKIIDRVKGKGIPVLAWTVTDFEQLTFALKYCDAAIFESFLPSEIHF